MWTTLTATFCRLLELKRSLVDAFFDFCDTEAREATLEELACGALAALCGFADVPALRSGASGLVVGCGAAAERDWSIFFNDETRQLLIKVHEGQKGHVRPVTEIDRNSACYRIFDALAHHRRFRSGTSLADMLGDGSTVESALSEFVIGSLDGVGALPQLLRDSKQTDERVHANNMRRWWASVAVACGVWGYLNPEEVASIAYMQMHSVGTMVKNYHRLLGLERLVTNYEEKLKSFSGAEARVMPRGSLGAAEQQRAHDCLVTSAQRAIAKLNALWIQLSANGFKVFFLDLFFFFFFYFLEFCYCFFKTFFYIFIFLYFYIFIVFYLFY